MSEHTRTLEELSREEDERRWAEEERVEKLEQSHADLLDALEGVKDGVIAQGIIALPPVLLEPQPWVLITAEALRQADMARAAVEKGEER